MAFGSQPWMYASGEAYTIDNSLRFDRGGSPTLTKTFGSAGDRKTYTWSGWIKLGSNFSTNRYIFAANSYNDALLVGSDQELYFNQGDPPESVIRSENRLRDPSAWYHILVAVDTTVSSPSSDRIKLYINGDRVTDFIQETYPSEDYEGNINNAIAHTISGYPSSNYFDGYLAEVYFIDGTALGPESFGETDTATNQWKPIDASDLTFGTNGFYQKYSATELAASFEDAVKYTVTSFTTVESTTWTAPAGVTSVEYLVVAGGGSGANSAGAWGGGGGGAGGLRTGTLSVTPSSSYTVTVGDGGTAVASAGNGVNGSDSVFSSITSTGGGGGGNGNGLVGGSGGGAGGTGGSNTGAAGTAGQGYAGGSNAGGGCTYGTYGGAGGGGSSAVGGSSGAGLRVGGAGTASSITGASVTYAGGGGGGITNAGSCTGGAGGSGGGGAGGTNGAGTNATGYGSGGGGNGDGGGDSGTGSSGIVIIRYVDSSGAVSGHTITANGDVTNSRAQSKVGDSSIKFDGTGDYLSIPTSTDWDFTASSDFTVEFWMYIGGNQVDYAAMLNRGDTSSPWNGWTIQFLPSAETIRMANNADGSGGVTSSGAVAQDAWHHYAFVHDDSADTLKLYIDGTEDASETASTAIAWTNTAFPLAIGNQPGFSRELDGYLDEIRISDTARYTSSFTPSTTEFTADSNTKLLIHSDWDGGLGADSSGNENDFSVTNLVATDQMVDSPTNNWCTMNPLAVSNNTPTFSEGNLQFAMSGSAWGSAIGTIGISSGKWYWEYYAKNIDSQAWNASFVGITTAAGISDTASSPQDRQAIQYYSNAGDKRIDGTDTSYGATYTDGDVIGVALDLDSGTQTITFYKNNSSQGSITISGACATATSVSPSAYLAYAGDLAVFNFGQDSSFAGNLTAQGNQDSNSIGDFYYEPPTDYLALCTSNLASPEIADPTDHFNTVLYTGTGAAQSISNVNFQPDWVWIKKRNATQSHDLFDSVRGVHKVLGSDHTNAEGDNSEMLTSFDSDGFTIGDDSEVNSNTNTFVSWNWKAGGTAVSNTDGSITSSVSANTTAGFSIVSYTSPGTDVDETVGHGLSQAPEMVIVKNLDSTFNWDVWTPALASEKGLILNSADDELSSRWSATVPSASLVTLRDYYEVNGTDDYIAYCFHSVEGYSKVGSYVGNGVADGTFVYTGFRPAFVILKKYNVSGKGWYMFDNKRDTYNGMSGSIAANASGDESTTEVRLDFVSNGIKFRIGDSGYNDGNFIYIAFAESPFKTSNAR